MTAMRTVVLVAVGVTAVAAVTAYSACMNFCGNDKLAEHLAPGREWKVVVFQRDCGATTGFSTQASVLPADSDLPNRGGNIFGADDNRGAAPAGPGGGPVVDVRWQSPNEVTIIHSSRARVFKAEDHHSGIRVAYETAE